MVKKICTVTGLPYNDYMIHWRASSAEIFNDKLRHSVFSKTVFKSSCFDVKLTSEPADVATLPDEVQKAIEDAQPFYKELYQQRMTLGI